MTDEVTPQINDESNPKSVESGAEIEAPCQPPQQTAKDNPSKPSKLRVWWSRGKTAWFLFGEMVTLLWAVALWDSYRPKVTIASGGTLNQKSPFGTFFIIHNQGALPISDIRYITHLTFAPPYGATNRAQLVGVEQNVSIIPQMKSLESYSLSVRYQQVRINVHAAAAATNPVVTNEIPVGALLLSFDISYKPKFFGKRTDTLYFTGVPDVDGNWQWLPTAHQSMLDQIIDTNLIPQVPATVRIPTNSGAQTHTK